MRVRGDEWPGSNEGNELNCIRSYVATNGFLCAYNVRRVRVALVHIGTSHAVHSKNVTSLRSGCASLVLGSGVSYLNRIVGGLYG